MQCYIVTGISGAGKSVVLKSFEDHGFESVDNLPLALLEVWLTNHMTQSAGQAVGIDIRTRDFSVDQLSETIAKLQKKSELDLKLIFVDADDEVIRRRYKETRRSHPLAKDRSVMDGVAIERKMLEPISDLADFRFDTSETTAAELRDLVKHKLLTQPKELQIFVQSFSFREGLPRDADMVFDVRFLRNPHYDDTLRDLTGKDERVANYIAEDSSFEPFTTSLDTLILPLLPRYAKEGKHYLTIAFGCTGGKHRSVYMAERMASILTTAGFNPHILHRDLPDVN